MLYKQPKSKYWWYKFTCNGEQIRESTKQTNKRIAEQMEAAHRTALAKGEVGIRDKKPVPTLKDFAERDFLPFIRSTKSEKPNTVRFYKNSIENLNGYRKWADIPLDEITHDMIKAFIVHRQGQKQERRRGKTLEVSTINRDLAALRRMFHLAEEWGKVSKVLPKVKLLPGENQRERVLRPRKNPVICKRRRSWAKRLSRITKRLSLVFGRHCGDSNPVSPMHSYCAT